MAENKLLPCPFCGGDAELDTMRAYRKISNGDIGNAVAIYCLSCSADMTMCHADHSGLTIEDMIYFLTKAWNSRSPDPIREEMARALEELFDADEHFIDVTEYELDPKPGKVRKARQRLDTAWKKARAALSSHRGKGNT